MGACIYGLWPWPGKGWNTALGISGVVIQFCIPLLIIVFCYGTIIWRLSRKTNLSQQRDTYQRARRNVAVTFCLVACLFVMCWIQHQVWYLLFILGYPIDLNSVYRHFVIQMVFLNCTVNPFIYLVKSLDFQHALREMLCCKNAASGTQRNPVSAPRVVSAESASGRSAITKITDVVMRTQSRGVHEDPQHM